MLELRWRTYSRIIWDRRIRIQILLSIALHWPSGRDSTGANADRDQNDLAASYYDYERSWGTEVTHAHEQIDWNLADDLDWQIPLLKPPTLRLPA